MINSYYAVKAPENLRCLAFFMNPKLDWTNPVNLMCNRACASIKELQVLGNFVRGLSASNQPPIGGQSSTPYACRF